MDDLLDLFIYKAASWQDWIEVGGKEEYIGTRGKIKKVKLLTEVGNIRVLPSEDDRVSCLIYKKLKTKSGTKEEAKKRLEKDLIVEIEESEGTLYIESKYEDQNFINKNVEVSFKLKIPKSVNLVSFKTKIGNINIEDIESNLNLKNKVGNMNIDRFTGGLDARLGVGNIICRRILINDSSRIELATGSIDIELKPKSRGRFYIGTNVGNIKLVIPKGLDHSIEKKGFLKDDPLKRSKETSFNIVIDSKLGDLDIEKP